MKDLKSDTLTAIQYNWKKMNQAVIESEYKSKENFLQKDSCLS